MSATETAVAVRSGTSSAKQQVQDAKTRILVNEQKIGAWRYLDWDLATGQAHEIDLAGSTKNMGGTLTGVPVGIKDIIDVAGVPTRFNSLSRCCSFIDISGCVRHGNFHFS